MKVYVIFLIYHGFSDKFFESKIVLDRRLYHSLFVLREGLRESSAGDPRAKEDRTVGGPIDETETPKVYVEEDPSTDRTGDEPCRGSTRVRPWVKKETGTVVSRQDEVHKGGRFWGDFGEGRNRRSNPDIKRE